MLLKVSISGMTMDPATNTPIIILKADESGHILPIWIGLLEATSIASALQDIEFERPMTHDLFKNFIQMLDMTVSKIEISDLKDNTFYARIHFLSPEKTFSIDARPSDAIAISLRFDCPIFVEESVMAQSQTGSSNADAEILDESEEGKKWADYLKNLSPEDFGKYKV